jgi:hypothetical protein
MDLIYCTTSSMGFRRGQTGYAILKRTLTDDG